jgi:hypothetical protein
LHALGFTICVGTDSLTSNENLSLFAEMRGGFQKEFPGIPPEEILQIVTVNPARALRQENRAGKIAPPSACRFRGGAVYWWQCVRTIIAFAGEPWIMAGGEAR